MVEGRGPFWGNFCFAKEFDCMDSYLEYIRFCKMQNLKLPDKTNILPAVPVEINIHFLAAVCKYLTEENSSVSSPLCRWIVVINAKLGTSLSSLGLSKYAIQASSPV